MEKKVLSCEFNIDTACVEVKYADGSKLSICCPRVEDMVAENMYERSELDWLAWLLPSGKQKMQTPVKQSLSLCLQIFLFQYLLVL